MKRVKITLRYTSALGHKTAIIIEDVPHEYDTISSVVLGVVQLNYMREDEHVYLQLDVSDKDAQYLKTVAARYKKHQLVRICCDWAVLTEMGCE